MNSRTRAQRIAITTVTLVAMAIAYACTKDQPVAPRGRETTSVGQQPKRTASLANQKARDVLLRAKWVGQMHNEIVNDFVANTEYWIGTDRRDMHRVCQGISRLLLKHQPRIHELSGERSSAEEDKVNVKNAVANAFPQCASQPMSVFGANPTFLAASFDELTSAYDTYTGNLTAGVEATDGSVGSVTSVGNAVLASASSIPQYDYDMLGAAVSLGIASSEEWNAYAVSPGFACEEIDQGMCVDEEMSMFSTFFPWGIVVYIVLSDLAGCYAGSRNGGGWQGCVNWGGAASLAAAMGAMM